MAVDNISEALKAYSGGIGPSIYGLLCRDSGQLLYIGKANDPNARLKSHMRDARRRNTPLYAWIRKHGCPKLVVLAAGCESWAEAERKAITLARNLGVALLNLADGGDQPMQQSAEKLAESARRMNQKRPKHIMRAYRKLESNARFMEKLKGVPYEKGRTAIENLSSVVATCRANGSLKQLDAIIAQTTLGAA